MDNQSAYRLTSKLICQTKRDLHKLLFPEVIPEKVAGKKRKKDDFEKDMEQATSNKIIENFEHEADLKPYYTEEGETKSIVIEELEEF
jgi:hypothetical protein